MSPAESKLCNHVSHIRRQAHIHCFCYYYTQRKCYLCYCICSLVPTSTNSLVDILVYLCSIRVSPAAYSCAPNWSAIRSGVTRPFWPCKCCWTSTTKVGGFVPVSSSVSLLPLVPSPWCAPRSCSVAPPI
jgi:hypothetical protein